MVISIPGDFLTGNRLAKPANPVKLANNSGVLGPPANRICVALISPFAVNKPVTLPISSDASDKTSLFSITDEPLSSNC